MYNQHYLLTDLCLWSLKFSALVTNSSVREPALTHIEIIGKRLQSRTNEKCEGPLKSFFLC